MQNILPLIFIGFHMEKVIDLRKDEYTVLPSNADHRSTGG